MLSKAYFDFDISKFTHMVNWYPELIPAVLEEFTFPWKKLSSEPATGEAILPRPIQTFKKR